MKTNCQNNEFVHIIFKIKYDDENMLKRNAIYFHYKKREQITK